MLSKFCKLVNHGAKNVQPNTIANGGQLIHLCGKGKRKASVFAN